MKAKSVHLLLGTHKGAFIFTSDLARKKWKLHEPFLKGGDVNHLIMDTRNGKPTVYACVNSYWFGSGVQFSSNFGKTWKQAETPIRFDEARNMKVNRVWHVALGRKNEPNVLYAGVDPGALFKSEDGGKNWSEIESLTNHPTRERWTPGAGGMMVHSFCFHPTDKKKMHVGISAAGTFYTENGGKTWEARNKNVLAEFLPNKYPDVGQCVHHMESHPNKPDVLYQQNHCGVYRSDNDGKDWIDISKGLPSRFGFPLKIHPHDPDTIYVIPEVGAEFRCTPNGEFAVYKSTTRGKTWKKLSKGLPKQDAYLNVNRQAMAADNCDKFGLYVGTNTGQLFYTLDEGNSWKLLADFLPPIYSVECVVR
ncbi:MAG: exo-alpha-sialidase [Ignavibacteriae bacterium]|nr:exo-alpha-sialidase [Ignavibacteriota bacterium]